MIADDIWSEIYEKHYDDTENICDKIISMAEKITDKPIRKKPKRAFAIAASIVSAAALTVSVGAACNWDFLSLLINEYSGYRRDSAKWNEYNAGTEQEQFMYGGTYIVPEGMQEFHEMTNKELELLDKLTVDVNKSLESDDFNFSLNGLIYDGCVLRVFATVTDNINSEIDWKKDDRVFTIEIDDMDGSIDIAGMGGCHNGDLRGINYVDWEYEWSVPTLPGKFDSLTFIIRKRGETVNGYTDYSEYGRITVELPDTSGLSRTYRLDNYTTLGDYGYSHLKEVRFSPLGVYIDYDFNFDGRFKDIYSFHIGHPPVFVTMNDGTVIEIQGGIGHREINGDGSFDHSWQLSQKGYMIDSLDIASVQIGDCTIELDDSMITEE